MPRSKGKPAYTINKDIPMSLHGACSVINSRNEVVCLAKSLGMARKIAALLNHDHREKNREPYRPCH